MIAETYGAGAGISYAAPIYGPATYINGAYLVPTAPAYVPPTTSYLSYPPIASYTDPNPAATRYAREMSIASAEFLGSPAVPTDEIMTFRGTLDGVFGGGGGGVSASGGGAVALSDAPTPIAPAIDMDALVKLALLIVAASWIGSALFSGRGSHGR